MKSISFLNKIKRGHFYYFQRNYCNNNNNKISLYSWGCSRDGKLGNDNELTDCEPFPFKVEKFKNEKNEIVNSINEGIKNITCGHYHTMIISKFGKLYTCGWTSFVGKNKLFEIENNYNKYIPSIVNPLLNQDVKMVSGGRRHTLILTENNKVFSYGIGSEFQLGLGNSDNQIEPLEILELSNKNIIKIATGWGHSLALSSNGDIYSWGFSNDGQTGQGNTEFDKPIKIPTKIQSPYKFKNIFSGSDFVIAITDKDQLVSFGSNEFGQLGNGNQINQYFPELIKNIPEDLKISKVTTSNIRSDKRISCGFSHCLLVNDDGELYTWGWNGNGQLGNNVKDDLKFQSIPKKLDMNKYFDNEKIEMVSAGRNHSVALTESGRLFLWGNQNHGKLGNGTKSGNQLEPFELFDFDESKPQSYPLEFQKVLNISTGFDHTVIELLEK